MKIIYELNLIISKAMACKNSRIFLHILKSIDVNTFSLNGRRQARVLLTCRHLFSAITAHAPNDSHKFSACRVGKGSWIKGSNSISGKGERVAFPLIMEIPHVLI